MTVSLLLYLIAVLLWIGGLTWYSIIIFSIATFYLIVTLWQDLKEIIFPEKEEK